MQYLIRTIQHNGQPFTDVIKAKDNETYQVVEAESKEEAEEMAMGEVTLRPVITKNYQPPEFDDESEAYRKAESGRLSPKPEKAPIPPRKGSE